MLISKDEIKKYLNNLQPIPDNVKNTLLYLKKGDIKKAALEADKDLVLKNRIKSVVNSAYFGLSKKVEDTLQAFTLLGIETSKSIVYLYLVELLQPKEWKIFKINFIDFQTQYLSLFKEWMIVEFDEVTYKKYAEVGALIPISVCLVENLLGDKKEQLNLIMESAPVEIGTLLKRLTGYSLFELAAFIAKTWEIEDEKIKILKLSECKNCTNRVSALTHLLFFYLTSKPNFLDLNSLIEFNPSSIELLPKIKERIFNG